MRVTSAACFVFDDARQCPPEGDGLVFAVLRDAGADQVLGPAVPPELATRRILSGFTHPGEIIGAALDCVAEQHELELDLGEPAVREIVGGRSCAHTRICPPYPESCTPANANRRRPGTIVDVDALDPHTWPEPAVTLVLEGLSEYQARGQMLFDAGIMGVDAQADRMVAVARARRKVSGQVPGPLDEHVAYTVRMAIDAILLAHLDDPVFCAQTLTEQQAFFADLARIAKALEPVMGRS